MKLLVLFLFFGVSLFADTITLENKSPYTKPDKNVQIAVQWASSARQVQEYNEAISQGEKPPSSTLQYLSSQKKIKLIVPQNGEYFRVLVWVDGGNTVESLTNWVDVIPNKTYTLKGEHLIPAVLMNGTGC